MTSTGEIIAAHTSATACAEKIRRTAELPSAWLTPARTRVSQPSPASACAGGSARLDASVTVMAPKSPALTHSAALTPQAAMTRPPMAGPMAKQSENDTFRSVLPASSWPSGLRVAATAPRVSARPTSARTPSAAARASTSGSHGEDVSSANVAKIAASTR